MECTEAGVASALRRRVECTRIPHERDGALPENGIDYGFFGRGREDVLPILCVKCRNSSAGARERQLLTGRERQIARDSGIQENSDEIRQ